jgi:hypothetical protein
MQLMLGWISPVWAAPAASQPATNPGQGLEISPPLIEVTANRGQTVTISIRLRNVTSGELAVSGTADDFGAKNETGDPQILLNETGATRYSLKYWVAGVPDFSLAPQEVKTAQIQINVPANAEPGGHYGVIRFTGTPPNLQGTGVSLSASIGALVLLKVNGAITDKLSVAEIFVSKDGKRGSFFENGPLALSERIKNEGSVHEKPDGKVTVYNWLGSKVAELPISSPAHNVLPDSIRRFDQVFGHKNLFGHYTVQLTASYAANKTLTSQKIGFWVIPWKLILLILALIIVLYWLLRQSLHRYNRYIIEKASKRKS